MAPTNPKQVSARLSQRLANFKLTDAVIKRLTQRVLIEDMSIIRIDPCIYGICIDYHSDKIPQLQGLTADRRISKWEVFPYGIIEWDRFHVRVAYEVDELEGKGIEGGFVH
jgi:hypothetical protein